MKINQINFCGLKASWQIVSDNMSNYIGSIKEEVFGRFNLAWEASNSKMTVLEVGG